MATFAEIQARVQKWLRDVPTDVLSEIPTLINEAQRELQRAFNFRVMEASVQFNTTINTNTLGTIADFKEPREKPYWLDNDNSSTPMDWQPSLDYLIERYQVDSVGSPVFVYYSALSSTDVATVQVYPKSDGLSKYIGGEYRVVVPYWKILPNLSAGTDTNWFTLRAEKYLVFHAVGWGSLLGLNEERGAAYLKMADIESARIISAEKNVRIVQPEVMRYSVNAGRQYGARPNWWKW